MGCRVLCSGLQVLAEDASLLARFAGSESNVALLQPDADSDRAEVYELLARYFGP